MAPNNKAVMKSQVKAKADADATKLQAGKFRRSLRGYLKSAVLGRTGFGFILIFVFICMWRLICVRAKDFLDGGSWGPIPKFC